MERRHTITMSAVCLLTLAAATGCQGFRRRNEVPPERPYLMQQTPTAASSMPAVGFSSQPSGNAMTGIAELPLSGAPGPESFGSVNPTGSGRSDDLYVPDPAPLDAMPAPMSPPQAPEGIPLSPG